MKKSNFLTSDIFITIYIKPRIVRIDQKSHFMKRNDLS